MNLIVFYNMECGIILNYILIARSTKVFNRALVELEVLSHLNTFVNNYSLYQKWPSLSCICHLLWVLGFCSHFSVSVQDWTLASNTLKVLLLILLFGFIT